MKTEIQKIIDYACNQKEKTGQIFLSQQELDLLDNYYLETWKKIEVTRKKFKGYRPDEPSIFSTDSQAPNIVYKKYLQFYNKRTNNRLNYLISERTTVESIIEDVQISKTVKATVPTEITNINTNTIIENDFSPKEESTVPTQK